MADLIILSPAAKYLKKLGAADYENQKINPVSDKKDRLGSG